MFVAARLKVGYTFHMRGCMTHPGDENITCHDSMPSETEIRESMHPTLNDLITSMGGVVCYCNSDYCNDQRSEYIKLQCTAGCAFQQTAPLLIIFLIILSEYIFI